MRKISSFNIVVVSIDGEPTTTKAAVVLGEQRHDSNLVFGGGVDDQRLKGVMDEEKFFEWKGRFIYSFT